MCTGHNCFLHVFQFEELQQHIQNNNSDWFSIQLVERHRREDWEMNKGHLEAQDDVSNNDQEKEHKYS